MQELAFLDDFLDLVLLEMSRETRPFLDAKR